MLFRHAIVEGYAFLLENWIARYSVFVSAVEYTAVMVLEK